MCGLVLTCAVRSKAATPASHSSLTSSSRVCRAPCAAFRPACTNSAATMCVSESRLRTCAPARLGTLDERRPPLGSLLSRLVSASAPSGSRASGCGSSHSQRWPAAARRRRGTRRYPRQSACGRRRRCCASATTTCAGRRGRGLGARQGGVNQLTVGLRGLASAHPQGGGQGRGSCSLAGRRGVCEKGEWLGVPIGGCKGASTREQSGRKSARSRLDLGSISTLRVVTAG